MQFITLPGYQPSRPLDFSPITDSIESNQRNALARAAQDLQQRQFGLQQQQFDLTKRDSDRQHTNALAREAVYREIAANPEAAGFKDPAAIAGFRLAGADGAADYVSKSRSYDLDKMRTQAQVNASNAQAEATRGQERRAGELHPGAVDRQTLELGQAARDFQSPAGKITPLPDGSSALIVDPRTGEYRMIQSPATKLSDGDKETVREADFANQQGRAGLRTLSEAINLSAKAWSGATAGARGAVTGQFGPGAGQNTMLIQNMITENALGQMKAIFGGNPTEGERRILLEVAGSVNLPHEVRVKIWKRAQQAIQDRIDFNERRAQQIKGGTYYKPGSDTPATSSGAQQPSGGERVMNGRRYVKQNGQWFDAGPAGGDNDL